MEIAGVGLGGAAQGPELTWGTLIGGHHPHPCIEPFDLMAHGHLTGTVPQSPIQAKGLSFLHSLSPLIHTASFLPDKKPERSRVQG